MHYELWGHNPGNLLGEFDTESEALALVRELLEDGWSPSDLSLGLEYSEGDPEDVPLPSARTRIAFSAAERKAESAHASPSRSSGWPGGPLSSPAWRSA